MAPPYDVVDAALQQHLYDRSPYNAIRVELTRDVPGEDRYVEQDDPIACADVIVDGSMPLDRAIVDRPAGE